MQNASTLQRESATHPASRALTPEQKEKWDRDGYLVLPQFFGPEIVDPINALIQRLSNPGGRSSELANRLVIDMLAGAAQSRRMRLADAPDEAFRRPIKFNDLMLECEGVCPRELPPRAGARLRDVV